MDASDFELFAFSDIALLTKKRVKTAVKQGSRMANPAYPNLLRNKTCFLHELLVQGSVGI
jgi:hypothetical protein